MNEPKVAIYIRLSLADEDTGTGKNESNSVVHQRMLIHEFLNRSEELRSAPRQEFVDDGYTGTNLNRPGFQAMMTALRTGECNVLVTKDFSRAMRDYTEMGNYLECVFPFLGVRYISINDGYDSNNYKGMTSGMDVVLRNIIYASYSKDLSVKTTTAKLQMMKQGKYVGSFAPYGYRFHPTIRNKLALDPESAVIVRRIFDLALAGTRTGMIARILNEEKILTPGSYFRSKHPGSKRFPKFRDENGWTSRTVSRILSQYEYTGATVGHKRYKAGLTTKKTLPSDRADWLVVEAMHDAIVSHEEFLQVQKQFGLGKPRARGTTHSYPLKGKVRCAYCRRMMNRWQLKNGTVKYGCTEGKSNPYADCPVSMQVTESGVEQAVLHGIQQMLAVYREREALNKEQCRSVKNGIADCMGHLASIQSEQARFRHEKLQLYERYSGCEITKEDYLRQKAELNQKLSNTEKQLSEMEQALNELEKGAQNAEPPLSALSKQYSGAAELTAEMVQALVASVYVYSESRIEIAWRFQDIFNDNNRAD